MSSAGPNFLPWLVAISLAVYGVLLLVQARGGRFKAMPEGESDGADSRLQSPCWSGFFWVSAGLLANAALITTLGFILRCALCFALTRNLAKTNALMQLLKDALLGMATGWI